MSRSSRLSWASGESRANSFSISAEAAVAIMSLLSQFSAACQRRAYGLFKADYLHYNLYLPLCRIRRSQSRLFGRKETEQSRFRSARSVLNFQIEQTRHVCTFDRWVDFDFLKLPRERHRARPSRYGERDRSRGRRPA